MKLWLKGISGSWCETAGEGLQVKCSAQGDTSSWRPLTLSTHLPVTQGSLWLPRVPQGSAEPRLEVRAPQTCSFILDMAVPSLTGLRARAWESGQCGRALTGRRKGPGASDSTVHGTKWPCTSVTL